MNIIEQTGKTINEAVDEALKVLGATIDEVEYEIIDSGSKGFFGIGSKPARVIVKKVSYEESEAEKQESNTETEKQKLENFNPSEIAFNFLKEVFSSMKLNVEIDIEFVEEKQLNINLKGKEMGVIIGKRGQTLDSLQYLVNLVVNKGDHPYISVNLDTEDYRKRRKETLENLAMNLAKKSKHLRKNVVLEPMNPYERRIIHSTLQNDKYVTTYSEGDEPFRYVVISPKK